MKTKILAIATIFLLSACNNSKKDENKNIERTKKIEVSAIENNTETFKTIDVATLEKLNFIISSQNVKTEEEIMSAYKPESVEIKGHYTYTISKKNIDNATKKITLIEDGLLDDSLAGEKTVMIVKTENAVLKVISIKENYKCQQNRGHQEWGVELCY